MSTFINLAEVIYPIGSVYCSKINISPALNFGGTWSEVKNALLSTVGYGGASGGQYSGNNTMTVDQMPGHEHKVSRWNSADNSWEDIDFQNTNVSEGSGWLLLSGAEGTIRTARAMSTGGANLSTHTIIHSIVGCEPLSFLFQEGDVVCLHS